MNRLTKFRTIQVISSIITMIFLLPLTGCQKEEEKPTHEYNAVLENPQFYQNLSPYHILMIAPGSKTNDVEIQSIKKIAGLKLVVPKDLFSEDIPYHSSDDENRYLELKTALENEDPQIILWALRGGYGSARLIEQLNKIPKPKKEKIVIGYSDMTALNLFLSQQWGWKPIHGSMLIELLKSKKDPLNFLKLSDILASKNNSIANSPTSKKQRRQAEINHLIPLNDAANQLKTTKGLLTGGNLTLIQNSIGTSWEIKTDNTILFLEDDGEKGYKIDRTLYQLKEANIFNGVQAIVFGEFTDSDEYAALALQRFAQHLNLPVFKTDEFGHGFKNYPLIYNTNARIEKTKNTNEYRLMMDLP